MSLFYTFKPTITFSSKEIYLIDQSFTGFYPSPYLSIDDLIDFSLAF
ncbi:hypothetical protein [Arcicella lustrica]|uniref:Uncharacterized protein n=1 Tax=Arcicella lustrica TaxID=2984196 RepID=A0ABU5SQL3_9BACT|nr:hypothetical protein [Arcicella sp. DC25W]MEA5429565.1 hypothetical protein [Arcicella sp. DC25W]